MNEKQVDEIITDVGQYLIENNGIESNKEFLSYLRGLLNAYAHI